jgi:hypothetical protein
MNLHLNLFHFFNDRGAEYLEDNLSRAFGICLIHDLSFLDQVLLEILTPEDYHRLRRELTTWQETEIDVQRQAIELGGYDFIYALSVTAADIDWTSINETESEGTNNPRTDLILAIGDTLLVFEFKRTNEDCAVQLRNQITAIKKAGEEENEGAVTVIYKDFAWEKLLRLAEQRANTGGDAALFPRELVNFIERRYPQFFPTITLDRLPLTINGEEMASARVYKRLDHLKEQLGQRPDYTFEQYRGVHRRTNLRVSWGWTREVLLDAAKINGESYLIFTIYGGETKGQGVKLWKDAFTIDQIRTDGGGKTNMLLIAPYLKWRHFNTPIADWYVPDSIAPHTHTSNFFHRFAGRHQRPNWGTADSLELTLDNLSPDWRASSGYDKALTASNRNYYDFSVGVRLQLYISYEQAQTIEKQGETAMLNWMETQIRAMKQVVAGSTKVYR